MGNKASDDVCVSCGHTRQWHEQHRPRHLFRRHQVPPMVNASPSDASDEGRAAIARKMIGHAIAASERDVLGWATRAANHLRNLADDLEKQRDFRAIAHVCSTLRQGDHTQVEGRSRFLSEISELAPIAGVVP